MGAISPFLYLPITGKEIHIIILVMLKSFHVVIYQGRETLQLIIYTDKMAATLYNCTEIKTRSNMGLGDILLEREICEAQAALCLTRISYI